MDLRFKTALRVNLPQLCENMETTEVIVHLMAEKILQSTLFEEIQKEKIRYERVRILIQAILRTNSNESFSALVKSLNQTGQVYLVQLLEPALVDSNPNEETRKRKSKNRSGKAQKNQKQAEALFETLKKHLGIQYASYEQACACYVEANVMHGEIAIHQEKLDRLLEEHVNKTHVICLNGKAGCGKSTFLDHLAHEWSKNRLLQKYDLFIKIQMEDIDQTVKLTLKDLIIFGITTQLSYATPSEFKPSVFEEMWKQKHASILLAFDSLSSNPNLCPELNNLFFNGEPTELPLNSIIVAKRSHLRSNFEGTVVPPYKHLRFTSLHVAGIQPTAVLQFLVKHSIRNEKEMSAVDEPHFKDILEGKQGTSSSKLTMSKLAKNPSVLAILSKCRNPETFIGDDFNEISKCVDIVDNYVLEYVRRQTAEKSDEYWRVHEQLDCRMPKCTEKIQEMRRKNDVSEHEMLLKSHHQYLNALGKFGYQQYEILTDVDFRARKCDYRYMMDSREVLIKIGLLDKQGRSRYDILQYYFSALYYCCWNNLNMEQPRTPQNWDPMLRKFILEFGQHQVNQGLDLNLKNWAGNLFETQQIYELKVRKSMKKWDVQKFNDFISFGSNLKQIDFAGTNHSMSSFETSIDLRNIRHLKMLSCKGIAFLSNEPAFLLYEKLESAEISIYKCTFTLDGFKKSALEWNRKNVHKFNLHFNFAVLNRNKTDTEDSNEFHQVSKNCEIELNYSFVDDKLDMEQSAANVLHCFPQVTKLTVIANKLLPANLILPIYPFLEYVEIVDFNSMLSVIRIFPTARNNFYPVNVESLRSRFNIISLKNCAFTKENLVCLINDCRNLADGTNRLLERFELSECRIENHNAAEFFKSLVQNGVSWVKHVTIDNNMIVSINQQLQLTIETKSTLFRQKAKVKASNDPAKFICF